MALIDFLRELRDSPDSLEDFKRCLSAEMGNSYTNCENSAAGIITIVVDAYKEGEAVPKIVEEAPDAKLE